MAEFKATYNEAHLLECMQRFRQVGSARYLRGLVKVLAFIGISLVLALCLYIKSWVYSALIAWFLLMLLVGPRIDYFFAFRRLRKSPSYNKELYFTVTDAGCECRSELGSSMILWPAITKVRRLKDGYVAYYGSDRPDWWPDSSLISGELSEVESLIKKHVADYRVA